MAKYVIDSATLEGLGDSIRSITGSTKRFTPEEMIEEVSNILNAVTFILVDKDGNEYPASFLNSAPVFTATANDIRKGMTAITAEGITEGTKEIPNYRAQEGFVTVKSGSPLAIALFSDMCEYTTLQAIICEHNTSIDNSMAAKKVVINDNVYNVNSTEAISNVTVDISAQTIKLGLTNDDKKRVVIRYMIIKEDV